MNTTTDTQRYVVAHADTCFPDYWSGHHLAHVCIIPHRGMTIAQVRSEIISELNQLAIMGNYDESEVDEYVNAVHRMIARAGENAPLFLDLEDEPDADEFEYCESVQAYFVFMPIHE